MNPSSLLGPSLFEKGGVGAAQTTSESKRTIALTEAALFALRKTLSKSDGTDQPYTGQQIHVLIDPTLSDPLAVHPQTKNLPRVPLKIDVFAPEKRPYLLCLKNNAADERALNATVAVAMEERQGLHDTDVGQVRSICAWLVGHEEHGKHSAISTRMLAATIARLCWVRPPFSGVAHMVFRFWDPRLTPCLPEILGPETWLRCQQALRSYAWLAVHEDGLLKPVGSPLGTYADANPLDCLRIDQAQWKSLTHLGWCNRLKRVIGQWDVPHAVKPASIGHAVQRALDNGLTEDVDILRFVYCTFTVHPRFDEHCEVRGLLNDLKVAPAGHFAAVSQNWTDEFIQILQSGAWLRDTDNSTSSTFRKHA